MVSAIVLAAGLSTRMGSKNKMLLPFAGKTVIEKVVDNIISSGIDELIVVTGRDALLVHDLLQHSPVKFIHNNDFAKGMTTSIQKGVHAANGNGYMICLGDMPFITSEEYKRLGNFFEEKKLLDEACICIAGYKNQRGNPVVFSSFYRTAILAHTNMEGCKEIVQSSEEHVYPVQMGLGNVLRDIDTLADYEDAVL